jgi:16S rRNA (adenine(1408)-N(1))-methyltransferase
LPDSFVIGIDPVAEAMAEASRKATKSAALPNALFVLASLENLPTELCGIASRVTVNFPWGSLLRAVAIPDAQLLRKLARLCRTGAILEVLINMQPLREEALARRLGLAEAALARDFERLQAGYEAAGFLLRYAEAIEGAPPNATSWGKKLHHGKREIVRLRATAKG